MVLSKNLYPEFGTEPKIVNFLRQNRDCIVSYGEKLLGMVKDC